MKVELTISRNGFKSDPQVIEVDKQSTPSKTITSAKLKWANKYLNTDCNVGVFDNYDHAKKLIPNIDIKGRVL